MQERNGDKEGGTHNYTPMGKEATSTDNYMEGGKA